jgi:hypothetical protein
VNQALLVRAGECTADIVGDAQRLLGGQPTLRRRRQQVTHAPARQMLADRIDEARFLTDVVDLEDVRVVQPR